MLTPLLHWDAALAHAVSRLAGWPPLDAVVSLVTMVGLYGTIWLILGAILAWRRGGHSAAGFVRLAWSLLLTTLLVEAVLKPVVARPRPDVAGITRTTTAAFVTSRTAGHSFPSGHAAQAAAGAYALGLMWPRRRGWLYALGALVAMSRVYLGVHYPLDIVAGATVGWAVARLATGGAPCEMMSASGPAAHPLG